MDKIHVQSEFGFSASTLSIEPEFNFVLHPDKKLAFKRQGDWQGAIALELIKAGEWNETPEDFIFGMFSHDHLLRLGFKIIIPPICQDTKVITTIWNALRKQPKDCMRISYRKYIEIIEW